MQHQSSFFHVSIGNFTLDWIFLHNQRLWWLWQIWSMPSLSLWLTTCPELVGQAPRMVQPGQSWDKERIKSSNWVEKSSYCCIDKKGKSSQCAVRQIPADQGLFESRWAMKWCLDVVRLRSSGILILNRSNEWKHNCVRGGGRPGGGQDLPVAGLHQAGNIISVKPI